MRRVAAEVVAAPSGREEVGWRRRGELKLDSEPLMAAARCECERREREQRASGEWSGEGRGASR